MPTTDNHTHTSTNYINGWSLNNNSFVYVNVNDDFLSLQPKRLIDREDGNISERLKKVCNKIYGGTNA